MKTCYECKESFPLKDFPNKAKSRDGKDCRCRDCFRAYHRNIYHNTTYRKQQIRTNNKRNIDKIKAFVNDYKLNHGCADCGYNLHQEALQFDHLSDKLGNISEMVAQGWSLNKIKTEIEKCEVVCANCHAVRTYNRRNNLA